MVPLRLASALSLLSFVGFVASKQLSLRGGEGVGDALFSGDCDAAYPGSSTVCPPGSNPEKKCYCVVNPADRESEKVWKCPDGFQLVFGSVRSEGPIMKDTDLEQWHCLKVTEEDKKKLAREPLTCPLGWTVVVEGDKAKCVLKSNTCTGNEPTFPDTEVRIGHPLNSANDPGSARRVRITSGRRERLRLGASPT